MVLVIDCAVRSDLENKAWSAVRQYSSTAHSLLGLAGQTTTSRFLVAHCECFEAKTISSQARFNLNEHIHEHGC